MRAVWTLPAALVLQGLVGAAAAAEPRAAALAPIRTRDVVLAGNLLYVARSDGLAVMDASDPSKLDLLGRLRVPEGVWGVAIEADRAYLAAGRAGVLVVDVADPGAPRLLARHDTRGSARHVGVRETVVFVADEKEGLSIVDVSRPDRSKTLATVPTRGSVRALALDGDRLATAEGSSGARLFDVSRPGSPRELAALRSVGLALDVVLRGGELLVAAGPEGLRVFDVAADPSRPAPVGVLATEGWARRAEADGSIVVISCGDAGLVIAETSESAPPRVVSTLRLARGMPAGRARIARTTLFVATDIGGVAVVDVSNPLAPRTLVPSERRIRVDFP